MVTSRASKLVWGVKRSFREYVVKVGGTLSVGASATWSDEGFVFPGAEGQNIEGSQQAHLSFSGEALFLAHGGVLRVMIAQPRIQWNGGSGTLSIADPGDSRGRATIALLEKGDDRSVDIAAQSPISFRALLTEAGSDVFGAVYTEGTALDPVLVQFDETPLTRGASTHFAHTTHEER